MILITLFFPQDLLHIIQANPFGSTSTFGQPIANPFSSATSSNPFAQKTPSFCSYPSFGSSAFGSSSPSPFVSTFGSSSSNLFGSTSSTPLLFGTTDSALDENGVLDIDTTISLQATWHAMEDLVSVGLVRSIGINNYDIFLTRDCLAYSKIKPSVNQIETHPYFQRDSLVIFYQKHGICVTVHTSLRGAAANAEWFGTASCLDDPVIKELTEKYNKIVAQFVLRWGLQGNIIVIPKTSKLDRFQGKREGVDNSLAAMASAITLSSGYEMLTIRLRVWRTEGKLMHDIILSAIKIGYVTSIALPTTNKAEVGEALKQTFQFGLNKREEGGGLVP